MSAGSNNITGESSHRRRLLAGSLIVATLAALVLLMFFTPRFVHWRGLAFPGTRVTPEFGRAAVSFAQIQNPWEPIPGVTYCVMSWRLLFPMLWHYLHLPRWLFLAMPFVGCVLVLWLIARLSYARLQSWSATCWMTLLMGALPWFFVSTGWLGYFDSWLMLGILATAFVPGRWPLMAACVLTPWVDERFIFALPTALFVRCASLSYLAERRWPNLLGDLAIVALSTFPYVALRAIALWRGDSGSSSYIELHGEAVRTLPWDALVRGLWSGYRAAWLVIVVGIGLLGARLGWAWGIAYGLVVAASAAGSLLIAADMSRSTMIICPALLYGCWLWQESRGKVLAWALPAVVALNFLLPAAHVTWGEQFAIACLPTEVDRWRNPPPFIAASQLIHRAQTLMDKQKMGEARKCLDQAIELEHDYAGAYVRRAILKLNSGDAAGAAPDLDEAMRLLPDDPYPLYLRGMMCRVQGDMVGARQDFKRSLELAPQGWPQRSDVERALVEAANHSGRPADAVRP